MIVWAFFGAILGAVITLITGRNGFQFVAALFFAPIIILLVWLAFFPTAENSETVSEAIIASAPGLIVGELVSAAVMQLISPFIGLRGDDA